MKSIILVVLMVALVATPCFAQEIEPDGMFSLHGTLWKGYGLSFYIKIEPFVFPDLESMYGLAFYKGDVYGGVSNNASYIDLLVVSICYDIVFIKDKAWRIFLGIMQPIGIGVYTKLEYTPSFQWNPGTTSQPAFIYTIGIMLKVDNNWTPPEEE